MQFKSRLIAPLVILALPLAVFAADPMDPARPAGKDGASAPAAKAGPAALCDQVDANHDGFISTDEAKKSASIAALLSKLDVNHEGRISVAQCSSGMPDKS